MFQIPNRAKRRQIARWIKAHGPVACALCRTPVVNHRDLAYDPNSTAVAHARCYEKSHA